MCCPYCRTLQLFTLYVVHHIYSARVRSLLKCLNISLMLSVEPYFYSNKSHPSPPCWYRCNWRRGGDRCVCTAQHSTAHNTAQDSTGPAHQWEQGVRYIRRQYIHKYTTYSTHTGDIHTPHTCHWCVQGPCTPPLSSHHSGGTVW